MLDDSEKWQPEDPLLAEFSRDIAAAFESERALARSSLSGRLRAVLPQPRTAVLRLARVLTAIILLAATGVVGLAAAVVHTENGALSPELVLKLWTSMAAVTIAIVLTLAAPGLAEWDYSFLRRVAGVRRRPSTVDIVLIRVGAMVILVSSLAVWLG